MTATTRLTPKTNGTAAPKQPRSAAPAAKTSPPVSVLIERDRVFSLAAVRQLLGVGKYGLQREIRKKRLRAHRRLNRWWLLGSDILDWLQGG
jgi:hypothetical protein